MNLTEVAVDVSRERKNIHNNKHIGQLSTMLDKNVRCILRRNYFSCRKYLHKMGGWGGGDFYCKEIEKLVTQYKKCPD